MDAQRIREEGGGKVVSWIEEYQTVCFAYVSRLQVEGTYYVNQRHYHIETETAFYDTADDT